jgi:hypothetical protein
MSVRVKKNAELGSFTADIEVSQYCHFVKRHQSPENHPPQLLTVNISKTWQHICSVINALRHGGEIYLQTVEPVKGGVKGNQWEK